GDWGGGRGGGPGGGGGGGRGGNMGRGRRGWWRRGTRGRGRHHVLRHDEWQVHLRQFLIEQSGRRLGDGEHAAFVLGLGETLHVLFLRLEDDVLLHLQPFRPGGVMGHGIEPDRTIERLDVARRLGRCDQIGRASCR